MIIRCSLPLTSLEGCDLTFRRVAFSSQLVDEFLRGGLASFVLVNEPVVLVPDGLQVRNLLLCCIVLFAEIVNDARVGNLARLAVGVALLLLL